MVGWFDGEWGWGNGLVLLLWVGGVAVVVWVLVRMTRNEGVKSGTAVESHRAILDRRYAAGDIDAEQYAQMRRILEGRGVADISPFPR